MSKLPSDATQLRAARAAEKELRGELAQALQQVQAWRGRATKAEQESAEWKARFDKLLERTPKEG